MRGWKCACGILKRWPWNCRLQHCKSLILQPLWGEHFLAFSLSRAVSSGCDAQTWRWLEIHLKMDEFNKPMNFAGTSKNGAVDYIFQNMGVKLTRAMKSPHLRTSLNATHMALSNSAYSLKHCPLYCHGFLCSAQCTGLFAALPFAL